MPYGRRPKLGRLDLICLGANPEKLFREDSIPAVDVPALSEDQQQQLYKLQHKARIGTLAPAEEFLRQRLISIARGRK